MGLDFVLEAPAEADRNLLTRGRPWLRLALEAVAIVVLATAWLAVYRQADAGAGYLGVTPVTLAKDGIPVAVDGERVYRIGESAKWKGFTGSFLLAGWVDHPYSGRFLPGLDATAWTALEPYSPDPTDPAGAGGDPVKATPEGAAVLGPWVGFLVVVRTHNADPGAADCASHECRDKAIDEVVWPAIPTTVGDQRVYRAADSAQYEKLSGSFLVGGVIGSWDWSCLIPAGCFAIGGRPIYPPTVMTDLSPGEVGVLRVHLDPNLNVICNKTAAPADCLKPFTLDEVVGSYDPYSPPYAVAAPPAPTGPILQVGPDGIPLTVDGQPVFRRSNLPPLSEFLLGGKLARDPSCPSPVASPAGVAQIPDCAVWTVDSVAVRVLVTIPESVDGRTVVVRVVRAAGSGVLVMTDIVVGG